MTERQLDLSRYGNVRIAFEGVSSLGMSQWNIDVVLPPFSGSGSPSGSIETYGSRIGGFGESDEFKTERSGPTALHATQISLLMTALRRVRIAPTAALVDQTVDGWSSKLSISIGRCSIALSWRNASPSDWVGVEELVNAINRVLIDNQRSIERDDKAE